MTPILRFQLFLLFSPVLVLMIHAFLSRAFILTKIKLSPQIVALGSVFIGYVAMILCTWGIYLKYLTGNTQITAVFYAFLVYSGFAYSYFHFFNMSETARRIRILRDLFLKDILDFEAAKSKYTLETQVRNRLDRLLALGQIKTAGDRYFIRNRFFMYVAIILMRLMKVLKLS